MYEIIAEQVCSLLGPMGPMWIIYGLNFVTIGFLLIALVLAQLFIKDEEE